MRGRLPSGPDCVDHLPGSDVAKDRVRAILETIAGVRRVGEACDELQIGDPRFRQLRAEALMAAIAAMEPGQAGRPRQTLTPEQLEIIRLKEQLAQKEVELKTAQARAEIAVILPKVVHKADASVTEQAEPEKKTRRRQPSRPTRGKRKST
jgi:hypothetical protein